MADNGKMTLAEAAKIIGPAARQARGMVRLEEAAQAILAAESASADLLRKRAELSNELEAFQSECDQKKQSLTKILEQAEADYKQQLSEWQAREAERAENMVRLETEHNEKMKSLGESFKKTVAKQEEKISALRAETQALEAVRDQTKIDIEELRKRLGHSNMQA